jgi:hypothetical protein
LSGWGWPLVSPNVQSYHRLLYLPSVSQARPQAHFVCMYVLLYCTVHIYIQYCMDVQYIPTYLLIEFWAATLHSTSEIHNRRRNLPVVAPADYFASLMPCRHAIFATDSGKPFNRKTHVPSMANNPPPGSPKPPGLGQAAPKVVWRLSLDSSLAHIASTTTIPPLSSRHPQIPRRRLPA